MYQKSTQLWSMGAAMYLYGVGFYHMVQDNFKWWKQRMNRTMYLDTLNKNLCLSVIDLKMNPNLMFQQKTILPNFLGRLRYCILKFENVNQWTSKPCLPCDSYVGLTTLFACLGTDSSNLWIVVRLLIVNINDIGTTSEPCWKPVVFSRAN